MLAIHRARSLLFVPADRPDRYAKALASGADAVVIDLEDAVAATGKAAAAETLREAWPVHEAGRIAIRINAAGTAWHEDNLALCRALQPAAVMWPKAEDPARIEGAGFPAGSTIALIESARGLADVRAIAACTAVGRLALGHLDLQADLGMRASEDERELDSTRFEIVLASRLAGLTPPIDGVTLDIHNAQTLAIAARRAQAFGFGGKLCIHPAQLAPLHAAWRPDAARLEWAKRVIAAVAASKGGAIQIDGAMVDAPVLQLARTIARDADLENNEGDKP